MPAQGQVLHVEVENNCRASVGQGKPWHGTSCDSQDRQWQTSIKSLFHVEELLVTFSLPWNCAPPPSLRLTWDLSETNIVMSYQICRRDEAAALGSEQSSASQWDYYLLSLELTISVEP